MNKGKRKYVRKTLDQVSSWIFTANFFVNSSLNARIAVHLFNKLSSGNVREIQQKMKDYDILRRLKLHEEKDIPFWEGSLIADIHILAYEYKIDPLVVAMCINPICKPNEAVLIQT